MFFNVYYTPSCQGSYKQLRTNERTKAQKYADAWQDFCRRGGNDVALQQLRQLNHTSGGAPNITLVGMNLS